MRNQDFVMERLGGLNMMVQYLAWNDQNEQREDETDANCMRNRYKGLGAKPPAAGQLL